MTEILAEPSNTQIKRRKVLRKTKSPLAQQLIIDKIVLRNVELPRVNSVSGEKSGVPGRWHFGAPRWKYDLPITAWSTLLVTIDEHPDGRLLARIEFNPSRIPYPDAAAGNVSPEELPRVLLTVGRYLASWLKVPGSGEPNPHIALTSGTVSRLDIARDFVLPSGRTPGRLLTALKQVSRPSRPTVALLGEGATVETLEIRKTAYSVIVYDQRACHGSAVSTDLRFEVQMRREALRKFGLRSPGGIDTVKCLEAVKYYWEWTRMGAPVCGQDELLRLLRRSGLRGKELALVHGYATMREAGFASEFERKHRRKLEDLLAAAGAAGVATEARRGRLDLERGVLAEPTRKVSRKPFPVV